MFGVERRVWDEGERREFEFHMAARTRAARRRAVWASAVFVGTIALEWFFGAGQPLHRYWENVGKLLLLVVLAEWIGLIYLWARVYGSWATARETRREME